MPRKSTTSQHKKDLKEKIIQSAMVNFAKNGFERTKMDDIAEGAGLAKGTLYLYFKSKEDLFYAICEKNLERLRNQLSVLFNGNENIILAAKRFYEEYPKATLRSDALWFETVALSARNPKLRKILAENQGKVCKVVKEFLKTQIEGGFFREDMNIDVVALTLISLYNGLAMNNLLLQRSNSESQKVWIETIRAIVVAETTKQ